jgi:hypothetical protein
MLMKREGELKSAFGRELKRQAPGFITLQYATNGAPDRSIIGYGRQTNWEAKHGTPDFKSPGDQELKCCRLAVCGHCRYIIWTEHRGIERTLIVHPRKIMDRTSWDLDAESWCMGFDMKWLVEQVLKEHRS